MDNRIVRIIQVGKRNRSGLLKGGGVTIDRKLSHIRACTARKEIAYKLQRKVYPKGKGGEGGREGSDVDRKKRRNLAGAWTFFLCEF